MKPINCVVATYDTKNGKRANIYLRENDNLDNYEGYITCNDYSYFDSDDIRFKPNECVIITKDEYNSLLTYNKAIDNIIRVQSNKKRELKPKKKHSGYVVLDSRQTSYRLAANYYKVWRTTIQTPYEISKFYASALMNDRTRIESYLYNTLGITRDRLDIKKYNYRDIEKFDTEENYTIAYEFHANYKTGFWEVDVYHTTEIQYSIEE